MTQAAEEPGASQGSHAGCDPTPLVIERVSGVASGPGVEALVRVAGPEVMRTTTFPGLADRLLAMLPGLERHRCEAGSPRGIVAELADTETPHLLEHICLELLALRGYPREMRGRTRWDFARDGRGVFRVTIECPDADAAERALREAAAIVCDLLVPPAGDVRPSA